jgi:hypothetical protein
LSNSGLISSHRDIYVIPVGSASLFRDRLNRPGY